jgi:hypothetical protein
MNVMTTMKTREIISDFAKEIARRKKLGPKPAKCVINFRQEAQIGFERPIYYVPIDLLRYRKDNGRISSDVLHYEKSHGLLDEKTVHAQKTIEGFLREKDKEKTGELRKIILHDKQRDPAIITCDGFLINGNRRKMVMQSLHDEFPGDPDFTDMKVVILPGEDEEGGQPTLLEIEQIENRYQLQSEGKAEYYAFDRAISIRRKIECGMTLEEQLGDDPRYATLEAKKFKKEINKYKKEYLAPLECIDRYLANLNREGLYSTVSTGIGDQEGRWQAFRDYYHFVYQKIADKKMRLELGIHEHEQGKIEDIAFKMIRMRNLSIDLPKVHMVMRLLPKWLANGDSKTELFALSNIDLELEPEEKVDAKGNEYDERKLDLIWARKNATKIIRHVKEAKYSFDHQKERETPIELMKAALKKLNHENLKPEEISAADYSEAMKIAKEIQERANELEHEFYSYQKQLKNLTEKYNHK